MSALPTPSLTSQADAIKAYLATIPGIAFRAPGDLVQFDSTVSIDAALQTFAETKVTGAPVYVGTPLYDEMTDMDAGGYAAAIAVSAKDYIGIVDVADLASLILTRGLKRKTPQGLFAKIGDLFVADEEHSVKTAVNLSTTHRFYALPLTGNLAQAAAVMARKRVHRIAISNPDKDNRIEGMITGSSIIRALRDNLPVLGGLGGCALGLLFPTGRDRVVTASATATTARDCLEGLLQHGVLGMPLVNPDGTVIANISLSDVRKLAGLSAEAAEKVLDEPALNLVKDAAGTVRAPITVKPSDTLATLIELMTSAKVHRVYVVDALGRPIGAITVTDVIRLVMSSSLTAYSVGSEEGAVVESKADSEEALPASPGPAARASSAPSVSADLAAMLTKYTAAEFIARDGVKIDKLIDIPHDASAVVVLRELSANSLSALPVFREETEAVPDLMSFVPYAYPPEKRYVGWVDAGDLCGLLLDKGLRAKSEGGILGALKSMLRDDDRTSVAAVNYSDNDPFWAIPAERNMAQVIRVLGNCKVHRLAVVDVDEGNHIIGIITQSAVVRYLTEHKGALGAIAATPVSTYLRSPHSLIKIPLNATVAEALRLLVTCKITGAPVIDHDDHIIANLSVSDVRYLGTVPQADVDRVLALPVLAFLSEVKAKLGSSTSVSLTPAVLHPGDSFGTALELLASSHLHRLYVVDDANRPVGVFTLTDAIRAISAVL